MLYIERDKDGVIVALRHSPSSVATEKKSIMDDEVVEFFRNASADPFSNLLTASDIGIIRIVEDVIELLVRKNVILFTELPIEAQQKIEQRQMLRERREGEGYMIDADDII
ncbi:MAG: hypothetical protein OEV91_02425 [Desulfobulbaceae bacterium]|nr:hypothetical protein [Desulfobulbaceae bacterium]